MAIADYRKQIEAEEIEKSKRTSIFSTQTKKIEDFESFINACSIYMKDKNIDMINLSLRFDFFEFEKEESEEDKKKLNQ